MRYRAEAEYDGTDYYGFQRQREGPTIQYELEQSINKVSGEQVSITFAGRTDSGVHAFGQVIAFDIEWNHPINELLRAMNAKLPDEIAIRKISEASKDFHPRFDARRRVYDYNIYNSPVRSPHTRRYSWHVKRSLNVGAMNEAARQIIGVHDFSTFGSPPQGTNTVREVFDSRWDEKDGLLVFRIKANAYLKRMVRSLVGTMKKVGDGSWTAVEFEKALRSGNRDQAGKTAPACGLFLMSVSYDADKVGE